MEYDNFITHSIDLYMGKPKSGKTLIAASYPKPLLYCSAGNDGGGRVILMKYKSDVEKGLIKVKNLKNDQPVNGKIAQTSIEKLSKILAELRKPGADSFKTIVIDTIGGLQDDYKSYIEFTKNGKKASIPEYGEIQQMMISIKDNLKRFSEEMKCTIVLCCHTREQEVYETSGLNKELRIVPDVTISTGVKFMKDASNIFYCCRKTVILPDNKRDVRFLTYVGPHPLMDTGTRDIELTKGDYVENFNYDLWQKMIEEGTLKPSKVLDVTIDNNLAESQEDN